jgi:hypothetical protein
MNETYKSLVNWYYIEDWSDYPGPKGRVVPDAEGYDNPSDYDGTELYISQGTIGNKKGNIFIDEEGNDVPFEDQYFEKTNSLNENKMSKEFLYMQKLAGLITESEYKAKLNEAMMAGDEVEHPEGMGTIELVTNYASHSKEIDANLGMDWESMTPKEELTWYKITGDDGKTYWFDEEELSEYN